MGKTFYFILFWNSHKIKKIWSRNGLNHALQMIKLMCFLWSAYEQCVIVCFEWFVTYFKSNEGQNVVKCVFMVWLQKVSVILWFWKLYGMEVNDIERKKVHSSWTNWYDFYIKWQTWHWRTFFAMVTSRQCCHGPGTALDMISFYTVTWPVIWQHSSTVEINLPWPWPENRADCVAVTLYTCIGRYLIRISSRLYLIQNFCAGKVLWNEPRPPPTLMITFTWRSTPSTYAVETASFNIHQSIMIWASLVKRVTFYRESSNVSQVIDYHDWGFPCFSQTLQVNGGIVFWNRSRPRPSKSSPT